MTPEMSLNIFHINHVKLIVSFDISKDEELGEIFNWKNMQPLLNFLFFKKELNKIS